jgi:hypothetical protein
MKIHRHGVLQIASLLIVVRIIASAPELHGRVWRASSVKKAINHRQRADTKQLIKENSFGLLSMVTAAQTTNQCSPNQ